MRSGGHRRPQRTQVGGGPTVIYGWHSALAALKNPRRHIHRILATENALARVAELGVENLPPPVDAREIEQAAGAKAVHQGIAVVCEPLPAPDITDLGDALIVVVLDQVTDPHNVGAVIRSAAAFGADAVILTERHGPADSGVLAKAASGGLEHVALVRVKNLARALDALAGMGFERIGLDSACDERLESLSFGERTAIVLGGEGKGLRRLTREKCDRLARLDVPGPIASLNVSNAAALVLYVVTRRPA
ncbi:MAG: TrmH family RNA methyltransferase [Propylenella sp.]